MTKVELNRALKTAVAAATAAGDLMRAHAHRPKKIHEASQHDIKLELDVRCQKLIERTLQRAFPGASILGEEGVQGDDAAAWRWVVDPIDGTVNFTYGIPHACVSIALQERTGAGPDDFRTIVGVVHDPFCQEMWTGVAGGPALLNGRRVRVSTRGRLAEAIVSIGFAKEAESLNRMLPVFNALVHRVRKVRIMGAAALALVYVAGGRMDGYLESGLRLWDIAAGGLILQCAGGDFLHGPVEGKALTYWLTANNGLLRRALQPLTHPRPQPRNRA